MYETARLRTAVRYGITAKISRFSESTRKNMYYFPKYMDYRTKQGCFMYVIPISLNKPL